MKKKTMVIGSSVAAGVLLIGGVAAVNATGQPGFGGDERDDQPLTGSTLDKASEAALDSVGAGKVTESERGDDRGVSYEVEVTLSNGNQVDVELDSDYQVVSKDYDHADGDDSDGPDDDRNDDDADDGQYDD
ncbi:PepSY domain-containing protein [Solicola gregarius]|uniref:PepSY domain-containing protein n=1 Tax=Solicola gregarius TaxID=2908642 RepID=A0AA46YMI4_9ACTN|nr:hypothetical protein [Solicola gregarius]UYM06659.1 hypothetical protein L0C25_06195 [Solicola gregarius]